MRRFPVAFLTNGVFIVTRAGFELTTPVSRVRMMNHYTTAPLLHIDDVDAKKRLWVLLRDVIFSSDSSM